MCLPSLGGGGLIREALDHAGFVIETIDRIDDVTVPDDVTRTAVLLFDQDDQRWMRKILDLTSRWRFVRPLMLTSIVSTDSLIAALGVGVVGFCNPDASIESIVRAVEAVDVEGFSVPRALLGPLVAQVRQQHGWSVHTRTGVVVLTDREWEILGLLLQRATTREMSQALFVTDSTVRTHVSALLRKLGATDRDDAVDMVERSHV